MNRKKIWELFKNTKEKMKKFNKLSLILRRVQKKKLNFEEIGKTPIINLVKKNVTKRKQVKKRKNK